MESLIIKSRFMDSLNIESLIMESFMKRQRWAGFSCTSLSDSTKLVLALLFQGLQMIHHSSTY